MADDPRLAELLLAWEEGRAGGRAVTLESLCERQPELLAPLRARVEALEKLAPVLEFGDVGANDREPADPDTQTRLADTRHAPGDSFWGKMEKDLGLRMPAPPGYEILGEIDRGGMAVVCKARHVALDRLVALKYVLAGPNARPTDRERFRTEAKAVARLTHPNIVQIHDVGEVEGYPYLVLEYLEGGDLESALTGRVLRPREAAALLVPLARAVHHAHVQGVIHRDIKPGNVLLTKYRCPPGGEPEFGEPKLADFGLARCLGEITSLTRTGIILGTPSYMAPEQAAGDKARIGPATDIHGLGALLYRMLTGLPPFLGEGDVAIGRQVLEATPAAPSRHNPEVPRVLDDICLRCLRKDPADRFASGAELAESLNQYLVGTAPNAPRSAPMPLIQRSWIVLFLTITAAVVAARLIVDFLLREKT